MPQKKQHTNKLGNPAIIAAATQLAMNKQNKSSAPKNKYDVQSEVLRSKKRAKTWKVVGIGVGVLTVLVLGKKVYDKYRKDKTEGETSTSAQIAKQFIQAFNPWGIPERLRKWGTPDGGTNSDMVYDAAFKLKNAGLKFEEVAKDYEKITKRNLSADLRSELSNEQYAKVQAILADDYDPKRDNTNPDQIKDGFFLFIEESDLYLNPRDSFSPKNSPTLPAYSMFRNARLTGEKDNGTRYNMVQIAREGGGNLIWVKEHKLKRLTPTMFAEAMGNASIRKFELQKK